MKIELTKLSGVLKITPDRFYDNRGFFCETWNSQTMFKQGIDVEFVQDNQSFSSAAWTIRGLHFQTSPLAQTKLVRCSKGRMRDFVVDIRVGSPTYGQWISQELSSEDGMQILVPPGFLHGFVTLVDSTEVTYKCSKYYSAEKSRTVCYNDPFFGIDWGLPEGVLPILSPTDQNALYMKNIENPFIFKEE